VDAASALAFGLVTCLVLQFRLWDDLEDVGTDRAAHPERVLARAPVRPFQGLLVAVALATLALAAAIGGNVLAGVAALDVWFLVAYRGIRPHVPDVVWRFPLLLAKYPAFVVLAALSVGGAPIHRLIIAALVVLAGACIYDAVCQRQPAGEPS
jgi:4-hydroxybenzoate polyprenyltransferase